MIKILSHKRHNFKILKDDVVFSFLSCEQISVLKNNTLYIDGNFPKLNFIKHMLHTSFNLKTQSKTYCTILKVL